MNETEFLYVFMGSVGAVYIMVFLLPAILSLIISPLTKNGLKFGFLPLFKKMVFWSHLCLFSPYLILFINKTNVNYAIFWTVVFNMVIYVIYRIYADYGKINNDTEVKKDSSQISKNISTPKDSTPKLIKCNWCNQENFSNETECKRCGEQINQENESSNLSEQDLKEYNSQYKAPKKPIQKQIEKKSFTPNAWDFVFCLCTGGLYCFIWILLYFWRDKDIYR